jgi:hypothetical protein
MQLPDIKLDTIPDPSTRILIEQLLNVIEGMHSEIVQLRAENQSLRDEIARLKGGSGKPDMKPNKLTPARDYSSEAERKQKLHRGKGKKNITLQVTREQFCRVEPTSLPPDAIRHGTSERLVQDLILSTEVIRFVREVWFVPSTGQTITAALPDGYHGAFGPHIQALAIALGHGANLSQPALLTFFEDAGVQIGAGTLARWLADHDGAALQEANAIQQAGLLSTAWQATDQTSTRVDGQNQVCHVLGNPFYTAYHTRKSGTRQDVLAVLWNCEPLFRLNDDAIAWMQSRSISNIRLEQLRSLLPWEVDLSEQALQQHLQASNLHFEAQRQVIMDALAIAAYHAQNEIATVKQLLSDDAAVFHDLTDAHALCWVHDGRHYAKLAPIVPHHQQVLKRYQKAYWKYYRKLERYRKAPSQAQAKRLERQFERLVSQRTGYQELDERIAKTAANQELLLLVLKHPELPLHNNDMELAARRRVRKRDVSFGPQSGNGARAWDSFQTIVATAAKLGVRLYEYLLKRRIAPNDTPSLAEHIRFATSALT